MEVYTRTERTTEPQYLPHHPHECAICGISIRVGLLCATCRAWQLILGGSEIAARGVRELDGRV